jgi:hypothetical protein
VILVGGYCYRDATKTQVQSTNLGHPGVVLVGGRNEKFCWVGNENI